MSLLNHLFASTESEAQRAVFDQQRVEQIWQEYTQTIPKKEKIIRQLTYTFGERKTQLQKLQNLLKLELIDIRKEVHDEQDLLGTIHSLEHSRKIKRVRRLQDCLGYAATKYQYVYQLLLHLYATLKMEANLVDKLHRADLRKYRRNIKILNSELVVEKEIITKMSALRTFPELLQALVIREEKIHRLDKKEKKILHKMQTYVPGSLTHRWVQGVLEAIEDKIHKAIADDAEEMHPDLDLEYVNRPEFVDLVKRVIIKLRGRNISEPMITAFVHAFREGYNHERD